MRVFLIHIIMLLFFMSCGKETIKGKATLLNKRTIKNDQYEQTIEIKYNENNLPISLEKKTIINSTNGSIKESHTFSYSDQKLSKIIFKKDYYIQTIEFNWLSENEINFNNSVYNISGARSFDEGKILLKGRELILNYNSRIYYPLRVEFNYDSNSNFDSIIYIDNSYYKFSKFDTNSNPFSSNLLIWQISAVFNYGTIDFKDLGKNNPLEIRSPIEVTKNYNFKYDDMTMPISSMRDDISINSNEKITSKITYEYSK